MFNLKKQKGQAFSTFQLLIAAVVALALLGVLMPMIIGTSPINNSPGDAAQQLAKGQINSSGSLNYTAKLKFKEGDSISAPGIADGLDVDRDQVYVMVKEDLVSNGTFSNPADAGYKQTTYKRSTKADYKIGIICDNKSYLLDEGNDNPFIANDLAYITEALYDTLDALEETDFKVCILFPTRAT